MNYCIQMESSTDSNVWEYSEGEEVIGDNLAGEFFKVIDFIYIRFRIVKLLLYVLRIIIIMDTTATNILVFF